MTLRWPSFWFFLVLSVFGGVAHVQSDDLPAPLPPAQKPNVIFILTDDLDIYSMPYLKYINADLAANGITLSKFFVTDSLCCPSRASILRSQFVHSHKVKENAGIHGGFERFKKLKLDECTLATWLDGTGYKRALFGKYLNAYPKSAASTYIPKGWDEWFVPLWNGGYEGFSYLVNDNGTVKSYGKAESDFFTDVVSRKASDFINRSVSAAKPFFLYLAPFAPHQPATPAPRHKKLLPNIFAPRLPNTNEADVKTKPKYIKSRARLGARVMSKDDSLFRQRILSMLSVDEMVHNLVGLLTQRGVINNTYIIFTSDNGFHLGQHRLRAGKRTPYEEDIRVPFIVRGPGIPAGVVRDQLSLETDIGPTISEWAGGKTPDFAEGRSLTPLLGSEVSPDLVWRNAVLVEHFADSIEPFEPTRSPDDHLFMPGYAALRTKNFMYAHYESKEIELYELNQDPYELNNLVSPDFDAQKAGLDALLQRLRSCSGAQCRSIEETPID